MITNGMGRVRVGRLAIVALPALGTSAALGVAILQGSLTAALSSAEPFTLASSGGTADQLGISLAQTETASAVGSDSSTQRKSARARMVNGSLNDICMVASQTFPIIKTISIKISSTDPVSVGDIDLNASALNLKEAGLPPAVIGTSASDPAVGGVAGGFGLKTDRTNAGVRLKELVAEAYGVRLNKGLTLRNLAVTPQLGKQTCS